MNNIRYAIYGLIAGITGMLIIIVLVASPASSQETINDKIFEHHPTDSNYRYYTYYNNTLLETSSYKQIIIYKWSNLSENAKNIITESMRLQGYTPIGTGVNEVK